MKQTNEASKPKRKRDAVWEKVAGVTGLYRYKSSGTYFANVRKSGKLHTESLRTKDRATAKRLLRDFKARLDRTDPKFGKISFADWLEQHYLPTLRGAESTMAGKRQHVEKIKTSWLAAKTKPMNELRPSEIEQWLVREYGQWSSGFFNSALMLVRDAFAMAVRDHALMENPAAALKYRKRTKPIRLTPTFDEFTRIIADVRAQRFNADAQESADFLEFMGLAGLGQAELSAMKRCDVDLDAGRIIVYRHKTDTGFCIPIYPQARALVEKLCAGKRPNERLFGIATARKALRHACRRLELPRFTQRSFRRCFITRCLELGIDVQTIARFQGHKDGGKLILDTYGHVSQLHSQRMALLLTTERPSNVIPLSETGEQRACARGE